MGAERSVLFVGPIVGWCKSHTIEPATSEVTGASASPLLSASHRRVCRPLANSLFRHRPDESLKPASKVKAAYYKPDRAFQQVLDLLAA